MTTRHADDVCEPASPPAFGLLGPVTVRVAGEPVPVPGRLDRTVLAHLLVAEGRALSVELLVDAIWGEHPPPRARNALQVKISRLRSLLGERGACLSHSQGAYRLAIGECELDASVFSASIRRAAALIRSGRPDDAGRLLDEGLALWRGEPLSNLGDHPRLASARQRWHEEWCVAQELVAEVALTSTAGLAGPITMLRRLLDREPHRPRARLLLMQALDASGRRAEALAVYDQWRRLLAEDSGLVPSLALQDAFERLLTEEHEASLRSATHDRLGAAPSGSMDTARWLAAEGEVTAALRLAARGSWWWWFAGRRTVGRDLLEELIGQAPATEAETGDLARAATWLAVFRSDDEDAELALRSGERALDQADVSWTRDQAVAAALLAERLYQRGARDRADRLRRSARRTFDNLSDDWGLALADVVRAKALLLAGNIVHADRRAGDVLRVFEGLGDPAGQIMSLDLLGYCAEIRGDLTTSSRIHRRALGLVRSVEAPEWEASQLVRLGCTQALSRNPEAVTTLREACVLAESIGSATTLAFAHNGLGLATALAGNREEAITAHSQALSWYERQESPAGISYSAGRLAQLLPTRDMDTAVRLATRSTDLAFAIRDPRAVAHGLEAVASTDRDPATRARALGGARAIRRSVMAPLPEALSPGLRDVERLLQRRLGDRLVAELRSGARDALRRLNRLGDQMGREEEAPRGA